MAPQAGAVLYAKDFRRLAEFYRRVAGLPEREAADDFMLASCRDLARRSYMKLLLAAVVLFVGIAAWSGARGPKVYACSAGTDFNPVAESDVIVVGTVAGWRPVETPGDVDFGGKTGTSPFQTVAVTVAVDQVLKGAMSNRVEFLDVGSRLKDPLPDGKQWGGSGGNCAAFGVDPTGRYLIMGLRRADDGSLRSGGSFENVFLWATRPAQRRNLRPCTGEPCAVRANDAAIGGPRAGTNSIREQLSGGSAGGPPGPGRRLVIALEPNGLAAVSVASDPVMRGRRTFGLVVVWLGATRRQQARSGTG